jgi:hypothetical protein
MSEVPACNAAANTAFEMLGNSRRRWLLYALADAGGEVSLDALTRSVAAAEQDLAESEVTDSQARRVYIPLYQMHIPRLEEAGVVTYDSETGTVRLTDPDPILYPIVRRQPTSPRWYRYYILWSLTGVVAGAALWIGALPAMRSAWMVLSLALVFGTVLLSGLQYWSDGR